MALAERIYGLGVRLLPVDFREQYAEELRSCFARIAADARSRKGRIAVVGVTVRSVIDVLRRAPAQHLAAARSGALDGGAGWSGVWLDVRHALRRLGRRPAFTFTTALTLGLGIAATASVFSLVQGVLLSPLRYPEGDRLVEVDHAGPGAGADRGLGITFGFYRYYAAHTHAAQAIAMYRFVRRTLAGRGEPVRLSGATATPSLVDVLRVSPRLGRWFRPDDARSGAPPTVVLSFDLWRDRFGGDPSVLGSSLDLGGVQREVIGVMPKMFAFPTEAEAFWTPLDVPKTGVGGWNERAVARLAPDADAESLRRELVSMFPGMRATTDDPGLLNSYLDDARVTPLVVPLKESIVGDVSGTLWILLGAVGFVLLIAVANVANLFLVRAEERRQETSVRVALGAGRGTIVRGFMVETLMVSLAAGGLGLAVAAVAVRLLRRWAPVNVPRLEEVGLNPTVLAVTLLATLAAALVLGLIPGLRGRKAAGVVAGEGGSRSTAGRLQRRSRDALMVTQVALALVLLIGSGLLYRTFRQLRAVDLGFTERNALTFDIGLPQSRYPDGADAERFQHELLDRLRALPGVRHAAAVGQCLPLVGYMCWGEPLQAEGRPVPQGEVPPVTGARIASTDYFRTLGIEVHGRSFTRLDETGSANVAVLSRSTARAYFGDEDPIGQRVRFDDGRPWYTVVGVASDVSGALGTEQDRGLRRVIYLPMTPRTEDGPDASQMAYVVSTSVPPTSILPAVRTTLHGMDPSIPLSEVRTVRQLIERATAPAAFALTLVALAAAMALLLGTVGVYAVLAYVVSGRTAEIGVRMALGARAADVRSMVLRQGGGVVATGIGFGLVAAFGLTRLMRGMLYGVSATDPLSFVVLTALLGLVAGLALWLPARRASRIEPMEALRP